MKKSFRYIHEPDDLQCGQAVLAMLLEVSVESICMELQNDRETNFREMKQTLERHGFGLSAERKQAFTKTDLPAFALLSLETPPLLALVAVCGGCLLRPRARRYGGFPRMQKEILLGYHFLNIRRYV